MAGASLHPLIGDGRVGTRQFVGFGDIICPAWGVTLPVAADRGDGGRLPMLADQATDRLIGRRATMMLPKGRLR